MSDGTTEEGSSTAAGDGGIGVEKSVMMKSLGSPRSRESSLMSREEEELYGKVDIALG